jgi:pimeloyl-ACP methyl ester carboxylesterase
MNATIPSAKVGRSKPGLKLMTFIALASAFAGTSALADGKEKHPSEPLVIKAQGSFFAGATDKATGYSSADGPSPGTFSVNGVYVEYQIPQQQKFPYPIVMIHGAAHTGKTYDETPDGREGWRTYFLRKGFAVYVIDQAGRGRSGFDPTLNNQAKATSNPAGLTNLFKFTHEAAWTLFRFGATPYTAFPGTQFPVEKFDQYVPQLVANSETTIDPSCTTPGPGCTVTVNSVAALLDKIGPSIVLGHSQGGTMAMRIAATRPNLVKAVVAIEPALSCVIEPTDLPSFKNIALLSVFGDYTNQYPAWVDWSNGCKASVARVREVGGQAENIMLPEIGITGNTHMLMMERNSDSIADVVIAWLSKKVRGPRH